MTSDGIAGSLRRTVLRHPALARVIRPYRRRLMALLQARSTAADESPGAWADFARERRHASGTILIVEDKVPEFDKHAGGNATYRCVRLLVEHDVKVIYLPDDRYPRQPYTRVLQRMGVEVLYGNVDAGAWLSTHGRELDWVMLARPHIAPTYIDVVRRHSRARLLYYTHDLHFLREQRHHDALGDPIALFESRRLRAIEEDIFRSVDCVLTASTQEVPLIQALTSRPVHAIPLFALRAETDDVAERVAPVDRTHIMFVGGFGHPPNIDAATFLVERIMPIVWRDIPGAPVLIVGSDPPPEVLALQGPNVSVVGYVPDLAPYFARARASVNAIRYGAGVKGKILSSLEANVPVVTTTIGNEGIGLTSGVNGLVADQPDEIASHVVRLFRDPELGESLATAGRHFVMERFGEETTRDLLLGALGLTFCPVCGVRSIDQDADAAERPAGDRCTKCGADAAGRHLADMLVRPFRRYRGVSLREALPFLAGLRITGIGVGDPLHEILARTGSYRDISLEGAGSIGKATDGPADLVAAADVSAADLGDVVRVAAKSLRAGGRLVFVVRYADAGGVAQAPMHAPPDPTETVRTLATAGFMASRGDRNGPRDGERLVAFEAVRS